MSDSNSPSKYSRLLHDKLAFFGAIGASLSHELKNVLATINEFSGLLEDLIAASEHGRPLQPQQIQSTCERIAKQIHRGEVLIGRLNRFAHSADVPVRTIDLSAQLNDIADLTNRFAKLKQVTLKRRFPENTTSVVLDPFTLQQAIYLCIRMALDAATEKRTVTLTFEHVEPEIRVVVESADPMRPSTVSPEHLDQLSSILPQLGSKLQWANDPDRVILSFSAQERSNGG